MSGPSRGIRRMRTDYLHREILRAAYQSHGAWRPWRGVYGHAERLARQGMLLVAGTDVMPPHIRYVITKDGEAELARLIGKERA